jgi:type III restriction enzyme
LLTVSRRWLVECVTCKDNTFPQLLLLIEFAHDAADRIYRAIVESDKGAKAIKPILRPFETIGSTRYVDFETVRETYKTDPERCHITHVTMHSGWEGKFAESLEEMEEVICYAKNQSLGFTIPYTMNGEEKKYEPDFLIRVDVGDEEPLNLVAEVTGEKRLDKEIKVATAKNFWIPAVNNHGGFGRWAFIEIADPYDAKRLIRSALQIVPSPSGRGLEPALRPSKG